MKNIILMSLLLVGTYAFAGDAELGKAKAEQVCKTCHGMDGRFPRNAEEYITLVMVIVHFDVFPIVITIEPLR